MSGAFHSSRIEPQLEAAEPLAQESPLGATQSIKALAPVQLLIAAWGVLGVLALLLQAVMRLGALALEAYRMPLSSTQWALSAIWIALNAYGEGYRAFQKRFSPRVVVRAVHLAENPTPLGVLLAPAYCMGFFHATRRAKIIAWATSAMVIGFIVLLRQTPQPWRGIVDAGVVVALVWGASVILVLFLRAALYRRLPSVSAETPER